MTVLLPLRVRGLNRVRLIRRPPSQSSPSSPARSQGREPYPSPHRRPTLTAGYWAAMSQENIEIVRSTFEAWNAGDMKGLREPLGPDVVMRMPEGWPEAGP